ncbi:hypothetical protein SAMD00019534_028730 [Acytostelium subglobosum LB1]|uniref:hypothetical protein n=1 Tax=Acytostelium subglobosum LB1 TaxID=1410327 RepID=UPI000644A9A5|nr:hypothetical protein SAMD00019534_028730 [Acytostelium subglobosum LB1]GAM19698.1 hypothetical protein SAMD00019534_028730 [Acytostelium subglobosum LB1]|eukprot:XP_012756460.1 hypothetical protein SAMD00019534_028730 [Acytostelium subglobosum LB1]
MVNQSGVRQVNFKELIQEGKLESFFRDTIANKPKENSMTIIEVFLERAKPTNANMVFDICLEMNIFKDNVFILNRFLQYYVDLYKSTREQRAVDKITMIWDKLYKSRGLFTPNVLTYNSMLEYYVMAKDKHGAISTYAMMLENKVFFSNRTNQHIIDMKLLIGQPLEAIKILEKVRPDSFSFCTPQLEGICSALLPTHVEHHDALCKVLEVFTPMAPDFAESAIISQVYEAVHATNFNNFQRILEHLKSQNTLKSAIAWNNVLRALMKRKDMMTVSTNAKHMILDEMSYAMYINYYSNEKLDDMVNVWIDANKSSAKSMPYLVLILRYYSQKGFVQGINQIAGLISRNGDPADIARAFLFLAAEDGKPIAEVETEHRYGSQDVNTDKKVPTPRQAILRIVRRDSTRRYGVLLGHLIQHYLVHDNYEAAIKLNELRDIHCKMDPNNFLVLSFISYHQIHKQDDLVEYWRNLGKKLGLDFRQDESFVSYFNKYKEITANNNFDRFYNYLDLNRTPTGYPDKPTIEATPINQRQQVETK